MFRNEPGASLRSSTSSTRQFPQRDEAVMGTEFEPGFSNTPEGDPGRTVAVDTEVLPSGSTEDKAVKRTSAKQK